MLACTHGRPAGAVPAPPPDELVPAPPPPLAAPPTPEPASPAPTAGPDTAEAIRTVVRMSRPRLQACAEQGLKVDPALTGRVGVAFSIVEGRVTEAHLVRNTTGQAVVGTCVVSAVRSLRFDPAVTAVVAEYPFQLSGVLD